VAQPGGKDVGSGLVAGEGLPVGPFCLQGAVEPLDLAFEPGAVGSDDSLDGAEAGDRGPECGRVAVGESFVGDDSLDLDAVASAKPGCAGEVPGAGVTAFVGVDLGIGEPGVADGRVPAQGAPSSPIGDTAQHLHVDMDQLSWVFSLIAAPRGLGRGSPNRPAAPCREQSDRH
jgi:hypothetical protein